MAPPGRYYGGTLQYLLGHPVRRRPSSNSRWIRRPATPSSMSARQLGRPTRRPPKHNQQIEIAKKGTPFGPFLIYCRDAASTESAPLRLGQQPDEIVIRATDNR